MINKLLFLCLLICLLSCNLEDKKITKSDSIAVFNMALEGKLFLQENIMQDTLFFIKSKTYGHTYPAHTKYFKIQFIEDTPKNKMLNHPLKQNDPRTRLDITNFLLKNDTLNVTITDCGFNMWYEYKMVKTSNKWKMVYENFIVN